MRLVKVSHTEDLELNNAHKNLKEIYFLGLKQAKITAVIQPISGVIMLHDRNYIRFVRLEFQLVLSQQVH